MRERDMRDKYVYLSGPITDLHYEQARFGWRLTLQTLLDIEIQVLSPMRHEGHLAEMKQAMSAEALRSYETAKNHLFSHPKMIVSKDFLDIERCQIMVVNLIGASKVSQGTLVEYGYAKAKGKTIVTIMEKEGNPHTTPFISVVSDVVVETLEDAAMVVNSLMSEGV